MTRYSMDKDDPGYLPYCEKIAEGKDIHVFVNGLPITQCVTVDTEQRYVKHYVLDTDGKVQVDPHNPENVWIGEMKDVDVRIEYFDRD